jgi:uncharacterized protein (DUF849 family)
MNQKPCKHPIGQARVPVPRATPNLRGFGLLALAMMLAACVDETQSVSIAPAKGVSAASAVESFVITVATADSIADNCRDAGIRMGYSSVDALLDSYVRNLVRAGYSEGELLRAVDGLSYDRVGDKAIARLKARGVRQGDTASLCQYGRNEIAAGSAVGRLLRTSE